MKAVLGAIQTIIIHSKSEGKGMYALQSEKASTCTSLPLNARYGSTRLSDSTLSYKNNDFLRKQIVTLIMSADTNFNLHRHIYVL